MPNFTRGPDPEAVRRLLATLPSVPYPANSAGGPNKVQIQRWSAAALAAGYPACEVCGNAISRGHWSDSLTRCPVHDDDRLGSTIDPDAWAEDLN
jgi:hypothetical protein